MGEELGEDWLVSIVDSGDAAQLPYFVQVREQRGLGDVYTVYLVYSVYNIVYTEGCCVVYVVGS